MASFQAHTISAAQELLAGIGLERFDQLRRAHINKRLGPTSVASFEELYPTVELGACLE